MSGKEAVTEKRGVPRSLANVTEPKAGLGMSADGEVPISKELRESAPHVLEIDAITQLPNLQ